MIRQPSTRTQLLAWHTAYMAGHNPPRLDGLPECGWYKRRLVKNGPWVPVRITVARRVDPETGELLSDERHVIEVAGIQQDDAADQWTWLTPISRAEFDHLMDYRLRFAGMNDARSPIDLSQTPTAPQGVL